MEQLLYISTSRSPVGASRAEISDILAVSRGNNARDGLSGLLVVGGRRFLQVLEGPADALDRAFVRIAKDDRHIALVQLERKSIWQRSFPVWEMGFETVGVHLTDSVACLTRELTDATLRAHIEGFAQMHSRAA
jgi:hypothetical protein